MNIYIITIADNDNANDNIHVIMKISIADKENEDNPRR